MAKINGYAGIYQRFVAFLIDAILLVFIFFISLGKQPEALENPKTIIYSILVTLIQWIYFAGMESSELQATFGKKVLGVVVTDTNGNRISFGKATGRYFAKSIFLLIWIAALFIGVMASETEEEDSAYFVIAGLIFIIGFIVLLFGYLMAGFTPDKQALHDIISKCFVVNGKSKFGTIPWKFIIGLAVTLIVVGRISLAQIPDISISPPSPDPPSSPVIPNPPKSEPVPPKTPSSPQSDNLFGLELVEPNPSIATSLDGVWKLAFASGPTQHQAILPLKNGLGVMTVQFSNGQDGTQTIKQDMKLWSSAKGLIIVGINPIDVETNAPTNTYSTDNFLIAVQSNSQPIFRNYSQSLSGEMLESPVIVEFLGYPYIGIRMVNLTPEIRDKINKESQLPFEIIQDRGVLVLEVFDDSSADEADLQAGDVILSIDGTTVSSSEQIQALVRSSVLDSTLNFEITRDNQAKSLRVQPKCCQNPEVEAE
jgi:uncharacterized RDD family membrane protein YckC